MGKSIYFAAPLFSKAEKDFNLSLAIALHHPNWQIFLPQTECAGSHEAIFHTCVKGVEEADLLLAILDGADADSGTCWEIGYAFARRIPIVGLRTDFRGTGDSGALNLMLKYACTTLILTDGAATISEIAQPLMTALMTLLHLPEPAHSRDRPDPFPSPRGDSEP
ncbi:nucleoside 2-deoxyribosyltransferase [Neosynechococcus sphagnicola]|uniref:nucleoside 2-deoxyribosyltransferase n=1 Tax=Neosynechococcus sphagnicola TaxID=1501145 RepID=UPI000690BF6A|nr:nucleoside 2-deoxyribosyltransferase [Neosynechococcus sphagnicola]